MDNKLFNLPEDIDMMTEEFVKDVALWPATERVGGQVYILKDNAILCTGYVGSSYMGTITVYLDTPEAFEIFKDDEAVKVLGKYASFKFSEMSGFYEVGLPNESDDRGLGLTVVDKMNFDFGFVSKLRYSHIPGFGNRTKV